MNLKYLTQGVSLRLTASRLIVAGSLVVTTTATVTATPRKLAQFFLQNASASPAAPQSKPKIADDVEDTEKKKNGAEKENNSKPGEAAKKPAKRRSNPGPPLDVTFTTDVPEADIFLNLPGMKAQKLGRTGTDGKLTIRLPRGPHSITASRVGQRIQRQQIEVRPDNTSFTFHLSLPSGSANPEAADTEVAKQEEPTTPAESDDAAAKETPSSKEPSGAEDVIQRYLDAKETESVTPNDWLLVQTQTNAALEKEPDNQQLKAQALFAQGQLAYVRNDYANALVAFNKAALAQPDLVVVHYGLGNAYLATNQPEQAFKAYQRASELNPELALAYKGMGDALSQQGKSKDALNYYDRAKNLGHTSASTTFNSARNLMKRKRWNEALKELLEISKTQPSAEVFTYIGDCYYEQKQPLSAAQAYRKATELDPKSALAAYRYGTMMFEMREYAAAMEALERALALDLTGAIIKRNRAREMANKSAEKIRKTQ